MLYKHIYKYLIFFFSMLQIPDHDSHSSIWALFTPNSYVHADVPIFSPHSKRSLHRERGTDVRAESPQLLGKPHEYCQPIGSLYCWRCGSYVILLYHLSLWSKNGTISDCWQHLRGFILLWFLSQCFVSPNHFHKSYVIMSCGKIAITFLCL